MNHRVNLNSVFIWVTFEIFGFRWDSLNECWIWFYLFRDLMQ